MTNDLEGRLVTVLHRRADDEVDAGRLLSASLTRGRARQRRQRLLTALGCAALTGVVAAVAAVPIALSPGTGETGSPGGQGGSPVDTPPAGEALTIPLPATGAHRVPHLTSDQPGAASRPDLVGTDPMVIHFGIAEVPQQVRFATWSSTRGGAEVAGLDFETPRGAVPMGVTVELARGTVPRPARSGPGDGPSVSATQVGSIGGRPVTQETLTEGESVERAVRWSPVEGIEARVSGDYLSFADLMRMASLIRLDQAVRCTVPLRLTALPAGTSATGCTMNLPRTAAEAPFVSAELTLGGSGSMIVNFDRQVSPAASSNVKPSITLPGGVQAGEIPPVDGIQGPGVAIFDLDGRRVQVISKEGYGADDVLLVAKGLRPAGEPAQAGTWPERPVS